MKNFCFFILLLTFSFNSFCQITWCPAGATWHNYYSSIGGYKGFVETKYVSDTIVAGLNCKKLMEHQCYKLYNGQGNTFNNYITLFTYEADSVVFMFNLIEGSNNWDTLYNFNTAINSRWHINSNDTATIKVFGAGTKIINGDTLQWRAIDFVVPDIFCAGCDTLYERIGVTTMSHHFGFLNPYLNIDNIEPSIFGICNYYDSTFTVYGNPDSSCLELPTGISVLKNESASVNIFPNPFENYFSIIVSDNKPLTFSLYNLCGENILEKPFFHTLTINTEQLSSGIYFYKLRDESSIVYKGKIIKD